MSAVFGRWRGHSWCLVHSLLTYVCVCVPASAGQMASVIDFLGEPMSPCSRMQKPEKKSKPTHPPCVCSKLCHPFIRFSTQPSASSVFSFLLVPLPPPSYSFPLPVILWFSSSVTPVSLLICLLFHLAPTGSQTDRSRANELSVCKAHTFAFDKSQMVAWASVYSSVCLNCGCLCKQVGIPLTFYFHVRAVSCFAHVARSVSQIAWEP